MSRVYDDKVRIDRDDVKDFYDDRAKRYSDLGLKTVLLGDQDEKISKSIDDFEEKNILPLFTNRNDRKVLDIGCGIGRWAKKILDYSSVYCGTDISNEMVNIVENILVDSKVDYSLISATAIDALKQIYDSGRKFDTVILSEVCMYLNDDEIDELIKVLSKLLEDKNIEIYYADTIAFDKRLTLVKHFSSNLNSSYNVIYRNINEIPNKFLENGFKVIKNGIMDNTNTNNETARCYYIFGRD